MDDKKLGAAEGVATASVLVYVVSLFLPWFAVSVDDPSGVLTGQNFADFSGWDTGFFWSGLPLLLGLALVAVLLVPVLAGPAALPELPPWIGAALGGTAVAIVALKVLIGADLPGSENEFLGATIDVHRSYGILVALLATAAMAAAGGLAMQQTGHESTRGGPTGATPSPPV